MGGVNRRDEGDLGWIVGLGGGRAGEVERPRAYRRPAVIAKRGAGSRLQAEQVESEARSPTEVSDSLRHVAETEKTNQCDREVAKYRHHPRAGSRPDARTIFVKCDVSDPVASVFDRPMVTDEIKEFGGRSLLWREAGDDRDPFSPSHPGSDVLCDPLDSGDLPTVREFHVVVDGSGSPDATDLDPAVSLLNDFLLRGGKTVRRRDCRCRASVGVGSS